jgi:hypothetical protein
LVNLNEKENNFNNKISGGSSNNNIDLSDDPDSRRSSNIEVNTKENGPNIIF